MSFQQRVLFTIAVGLLLIVLLLLAWRVRNVLLIAFAGFLMAVFLRACAGLVRRVTKLPEGWSLALACVLLAGLSVLGLWLLLPPILEQVTLLFNGLPSFLAQIRVTLQGSALGERLLEQLPRYAPLSGQQGMNLGTLAGQLLSTATVTVATLANALLVLVTGIFFAAEPKVYQRGILHLIPKPARPQARAIMNETGDTIGNWLVGQFIAMSLVGLLSWLGLTIIGVPLALVMGVLAGLLDFIPYFGPVLAIVPAVLLGLTQGFGPAIWVTIVYVLIQQLEGNLIQPLIQKRAVSIPPALLALALVVMGQLFGFLGLLVATPLTAVLMVLVKRLYVEDVLDDHLMEEKR